MIGPNGVDPAIWRYSPSQLDTYLRCPRKYWFNTVAGLKPPQSKSAAVGERVHSHLQGALETGQPPDDPRALAALAEFSKIRAAGGGLLEDRLQVAELPSISELAEGLLVEVWVEVPIDARRTMRGRVDVADFSGPVPEITDWKTTSDLKYAKTEYQLELDPQMMVYAKWALTVDEDADSCVVRHVYIPTRGAARAVAVEATVSREHVEDRWITFLHELDGADRVRMASTAAEVEPRGETNGECEKYGGCAHLGRCAAMMFGDVVQIGTGRGEEMTDQMNARIAELKAKKAQANGAPAPAAAQTAPASAAESPAEKLARLRALKAGKAVEPPAPAAEEPEPSPAMQLVAQGKGLEKEARIAAIREASAEADRKIAVVEAVRGRAPDPQAAPASRSRIGTLYLDCAPVASDPQRAGLLHHVLLESWVEPALSAVRAKTGIGWQMHEYRKGTGALCDEVAALEAPEHLVVDTTTPLGKVLFEVLVPRADQVVRGFR